MDTDMIEQSAAPAGGKGALPSQESESASRWPALVDVAFDAMPAQYKNGLISKGDVVLVLDQADLTRTISLDSMAIGRKVPTFMAQHLVFQTPYEHDLAPIKGIKKLFILEQDVDSQKMPVLRLKPLDTPATVKPGPSQPDRPEVAPQEDAEIKEELNDAASTSENAAVPESTSVNWIKVYDSFFCIMRVRSISMRRVRMPENAKDALPLIEGLVTVSQKYNALHVIRSAVKSLTSDWISNRTLFSAVAADPYEWLKISIQLENELVYKEAFIHLVGQYDHLAPQDMELPEMVLQAISFRSQELRTQCLEINQALLTSSLKKDFRMVNQRSAPLFWLLTNIWSDWIKEHLSFITSPGQPGGIHSTLFCEHPRRDQHQGDRAECLTVAGFYRTLYRAGDAYLLLDDVLAKWNRQAFSMALDRNTASASLAAMKARGKELAAPLIRSSLQYERRDELPYLTCVENVDVPWAGEEDEDDMDIDD